MATPSLTSIETVSVKFLKYHLAKNYQFTPMEVEVLLKLIEHADRSKVAASLGVSLGTVKTHLGKCFLKTKTESQLALVLAVLRGPVGWRVYQFASMPFGQYLN